MFTVLAKNSAKLPKDVNIHRNWKRSAKVEKSNAAALSLMHL